MPLPTAFLLLFFIAVLPVQAQTLRYLGQQIVPHEFDHAGTTVGGLSGLDYDPASKRYVAISDDRSERQAARFYTLELDISRFNTRGRPGFEGVRFLDVTTLKSASGLAHAQSTVDPEAIRYATDGGFWWANEGNTKRGIPPSIERISPDGTLLRTLDIPRHVLPSVDGGVRNNLAFESLAIADGKLYVGTENALLQDGPEADVNQPSSVRIMQFDEASGKRLAEHVYMVDTVSVAPPLPGLFRTNGLVELLGGQGVLLALERRYVLGVGNGARIYRLDLTGASDVSNRFALGDGPFTPIRKTLLLDLEVLGVDLDNLEGMTWGPRLPTGQPTLILVSDNNFSGRQVTQFLAFAFIE